MTILALYSNKGGVGKTTTAVNLSYLAARIGIKTLVCDLDPQGSTSYYFRIKPKLKTGAKGFVRGGKPIVRSIKGTDYKNLDLLPADFTHRHLDTAFFNRKRSAQRLHKILYPLKMDYELIVLDCPVSIGTLAENIFNTADHILVPLIPTVLSLRTYAQLLTFCKENQFDREKVLAFFSMVDNRKRMHRDIMTLVQRKFRGVQSSFVCNLSVIERMGTERQPVPVFSPESAASNSYRDLWSAIQAIIFSHT